MAQKQGMDDVKQGMDDVKQERLQANALVVHQVIGTLGRSGELQRVQVRHLWENRYRVNVLIGDDVPSTRIGDSYFLVTDSAGNILASTPPLRLPGAVV